MRQRKQFSARFLLRLHGIGPGDVDAANAAFGGGGGDPGGDSRSYDMFGNVHSSAEAAAQADATFSALSEQAGGALGLDTSRSWWSASGAIPRTAQHNVPALASLALSAAGFGLPGLALFSSPRFAYGPEAAAWNDSMRQQGRPFHDPETGVWTMPEEGSIWDTLNPMNWHPGPVQEGNYRDPGGDERKPKELPKKEEEPEEPAAEPSATQMLHTELGARHDQLVRQLLASAVRDTRAAENTDLVAALKRDL